MNENVVAIFIPLGFFVMVAYITQTLTEWRRQKERTRLLTEFQTKLLDRMGSGAEFAAFFQSPGGDRFLDTLSLEKSHPYDRILRAVQAGVVMGCLAMGLLYLGRVVDFDGIGFTILGVIVLSLGAGFLLSALAAWGISRSAGLLDVQARSTAA